MKRNFKLILPIAAVIIVVIGTVVYLNRPKYAEKAVKIVDLGGSICTQDVPSSFCGSYEVKVQTSNGQKSTYYVAGYSDRDSKKYDELSGKLYYAKEQSKEVTLVVDNENVIVEVK